MAELVELSCRQSIDGRQVTLDQDQIEGGTLKRSPSRRINQQLVSVIVTLFKRYFHVLRHPLV